MLMQQSMPQSNSEVAELGRGLARQAITNSVNAAKLQDSITNLAMLGIEKKESFDSAMKEVQVAHQAQALFNSKTDDSINALQAAVAELKARLVRGYEDIGQPMPRHTKPLSVERGVRIEQSLQSLRDSTMLITDHPAVTP
jgi:hypothetical protein